MILDTKAIIRNARNAYLSEIGTPGKPLLNELYPYQSLFGVYKTQPENYNQLMREFKKCPEAIGIVNALITDICSDGYIFKGPSYRIKQAENFSKENLFKQEIKAVMYDWLIFGDGAFWVGKISKEQVEKAVSKFKESKPETKEFNLKQAFDEDYSVPKTLRHIAWSTMNIVHDTENITGFRQIIGTKTRIWRTDEIIHAMFMKIDGKAYGFSPFIGAQSIVTTLSLIKDLNGNFFENGGVPDWMFILPKEMAGNPSVEALKKTLAEKRISSNKSGSLVLTGEVTPMQLNKFDKDMEFRQLAQYYAGILATAFNMPYARIQALLGGTGDSKSADLSDAGYWRSVSSAQDYWEELLNSQLFEPYFNVEIKFNRSYKQDEIREAQRNLFRADHVHKVIGDLKIPVKKEWLLDQLGMTQDEVDDFDVKELIEKIGNSNSKRQNLPNGDLIPGEQTAEANKKRSSTQSSKNKTQDF